MAQDSGSSQLQKADVDIDDLEVSIYILCKNPANFKTTCAFLTRRGWPTQASGNVSSAIEYIAEHRPDFVMVSFSHTSPAIVKLPELITQTFNLECIGFVESGDAGANQRLTNIRMRHKVSGMPSGPNFHRSIRKILQDRFDTSNANQLSATTQSSEGQSPIKSGQNDGLISSEIALQNMYSGESSSAQPSSGIIYQKGSGQGEHRSIVQQTGGARENSNQTLTHNQGGEFSQSSSQNHGAVQGANSGEMQDGKFGESSNRVEAQAPSHSSSDSHASEPGSSDTVTSGKYTMGKSRRRSLKEVTRDSARPAASNGYVSGAEGRQNPIGADFAAKDTADLVGLLKKSLFGDSDEPVVEAQVESAPSDPQSALERAVGQAISSICTENLDVNPILLNSVNRIGVFPIDAAGTSGYLVLALASLPEADQPDFFGRSEQALKSAFAATGVQGDLEPGFWVSVSPVQFLPWAQSSGSFNLTMSHQGAEIGAAFFPAGPPLPKAKGAEKGMHTIGIDHIATGHPVPFKAYLHLKKNQKYFLYLRNGRVLQPEQKSRLKNRNVRDLYMKSVDIENVRHFLATAFLQGLIKKIGSDAA